MNNISILQMKHAVIILAHRNFDHLIKMVKYFDSDFDIFIHIDKKSNITSEQINILYENKNIRTISRKFSVHWGGFSILKCELYMLELSLNNSKATHFHLLSGQDYPIKPLSTFKSFFLNNRDKNYISYNKLPTPIWDGGTYKRFQYFYLFDYVNVRDANGYNVVKKILNLQRKLNIKRRIPDNFDNLYGGSQWFSITRNSVNLVLNYSQKSPSFLRKLRFTFAPEETYITSILVNLLEPQFIVNNNLRWIRWMLENGSYPANIGKEHIKMLFWQNTLFARKFEYPICKEVIDVIDKFMLPDVQIKYSETGTWLINSLSYYEFNNELADSILKVYNFLELYSAIDLGCGCGHYVAYWRTNGMSVVGYDGNPYCPDLSSLLLSNCYCEIADLTDELIMEDNESPFDLVVCIDVMSYIPPTYTTDVLLNFRRICKKFIILSWPENRYNDKWINLKTPTEVDDLFQEYGFVKDIGLTNYINYTIQIEERYKNLYVFKKKNINN